MARIRTIKPEFWTNERLSEEHIEVHMAAAALLNYADDDGYFNANPKLFVAACFPIRELSMSAPEILRRLQSIGYIRIGTDTEGKRIGQVIKFAYHQKISHKTESKLSKETITWDVSGNSPEILRSPQDILRPEQGTGNREQGTGNKTSDAGKPARFDPLAIELPECIPADAWAKWIAYRRSRKLTNTEQTIHGQIAKLEEFARDGHDPSSVIRESIDSGWQGLFSPRRDLPRANGRPSAHVLPPAGVGAYGVTTAPTHPDAENFEGVM